MFKQTLFVPRITFGCDPEIFLTKNGAVIGSERILPEEGIVYDVQDNTTVVGGEPSGRIIIDGVQAELNPRPNTCRANLSKELRWCFAGLANKLATEGVEINFSNTVEVAKEELDSLSERSRTFGCAPSFNAYNAKAVIGVDPKEYRLRSAGGHLHLGTGSSTKFADLLKQKDGDKRLVRMFDIIVGNTCVLIDRADGNAERRKVYGRAGEYRLPSYGIEYRTLSNFWLQSYQLMSLAFGLARQAVAICAYSTPENDYESAILALVNMDDIERAINTNDFELAYANFAKIRDTLIAMTPATGDEFPIHREIIGAFEHFIKRGSGYFFKQNPLQHWIELPDGHGTGWEAFLRTTVTEDMKAIRVPQTDGVQSIC